MAYWRGNGAQSSQQLPNKALHPTAYSLRFGRYAPVAPAFGSG
jgi:hypothetical protein